MIAPTVVPAKAGTQGQTLYRQFIIEVVPLRIMTLDQFELPGASPFLDSLLAQDCMGHGLVKFGKDEPIDAVILHKADNRIRPMLPNTTCNVGGYANVKRTVALAGKNVNTRAFWRHRMEQWPWVPAFAGTTGIVSTQKRSPERKLGCRFNASRR